jgi:hypothetical protein
MGIKSQLPFFLQGFRSVAGWIVLLAILVAHGVHGQTSYSAWSDSQRIYINTAATGANVAGTVTNFPVLIRLTPSNFSRFSRTKTLGADIRFATSSGVHLNYQIERWKDGTNNADTAEIWVKVPSIAGNSADQFLRVYYGNSQAADSSRSTRVFDTLDGFFGVWHLSDSAGNITDATSKGYNGTRNGNQSRGTGAVGYCQNYDGNGDYTDMGNYLNPGTLNFTASAWIKRDSMGIQTIMGKTNGDNPSSSYGWIFTFDPNNNTHVYIASGGAAWGDAGSFTLPSSLAITDRTTWHHVVAVINKSANASCKLYIDGVDRTGTAQGSITGVGTIANTLAFRLFSESDNGYQCRGALDEGRVEFTARSADWVKLSYETQRPAAGCVRVQVSAVPVISTEPAGVSVAEGSGASMSVKATVTAGSDSVFKYEWFKNGVASGNIVSGKTTATMTIDTVKPADSGTYYCVVHNEYGADTSVGAKLTVTAPQLPPTITKQPEAVTVYQTQTASMSVVASGAGTLSYQWFKDNAAVTGKTAATLTISSAQFSDSGWYWCVVTNASGSTASDTVKLTVLSGVPGVTAQPNDTAVAENSPFSLSVTAEGPAPLSYKWYKGSTLVGTANPYSVSGARSADEGSYFCIVSNTFGACTSKTATVSVSPNRAVSNPIMLSAALSDSTHVLLSVLRYSGLLTSTPDNAFTWDPDTVMIWYSSAGYPSLTNPQTVNCRISKNRLKAAGGDQFDTLVKVPRLGCNSYYFMGSVKWMSTAQPPAADSIPRFGDSLAAGASVYMCDTARLKNPLAMSFKYTAPSDTVTVTIAGLDSSVIRWDLIAQLIVRYSVAGESYIDLKMEPSTLRGKNTYSFPVANPRFSGESAAVNWQLFFKGTNNNQSDTVKATSTIGSKRPANTLKLDASEVRATQVTLSWTNSGTPYDSFRIWYATAEVPDSNILPSVYSQVTVIGSLTKTIIRNLKEQTTYYFGIQGQQLKVWSNIPAQAKAHTTTEKDTSQAIANTMRILALSYDSAGAKIRITYRIDNLGFPQQCAGFMWTQRDSLPRPLPSVFTVEPSASPRTGEIKYTDIFGSQVTHEFDLWNASPSLEYGKSYYFAGWVSKVGEKWAKPTDSSIFYYTLPQPKVIPVRIFPNTIDMVKAFNNQVVLRKIDQVDLPVTLRIVNDLPLAGSGLVPVSVAFNLETNSSSHIRLLTGLAYDTVKIPAGAAKSDIRMYHYDTTRKVWLIDTAAITEDTVMPVLYVKKYLSECRYPFILAVDIKPPTITVTGDTSSALSFGDSLSLTVQVDDNIANPTVSLQAGRGDEEMVHHDTLTSSEIISGKAWSWGVPSDVVQGSCGIRVHITADDSRTSVIADVSRDMNIEKVDAVKPVREEWLPLGATGVLDSQSVKKALDEFAAEGKQWEYDIYKLRLFRFMKTQWMEYSDAGQDSFSFTPGRVIWLKTRNEEEINFGGGRSVTLKSPFILRLPAKSWTDFCLPYRFNIRIGDILSATNDSGIDALQFYQWHKSSSDGLYTAQEFYLPVNGIGKPTDVLFYIDSNSFKSAYTVWNDRETEVLLRIPGIPEVYSKVGQGVMKSTGSKGWSVAVRSSASNGALSPVFCAYSAGGKGTIAYPCPPSWSKVHVGIYNSDRSEVYGNVITRELKNGGYTYELVFENGLDDRTMVNYTVERLEGDGDIKIAVIDPSSGAISAEESALSVEIGGKSRAYRLLAIGTNGYINGLGSDIKQGDFALDRITPNPFNGRVEIEFTIPYGGIEKVRCGLLDHRGRVLWSAQPGQKVHPGKNSVIWTPDLKHHLAAGAYFVRLTGYSGNGNKTGEKLAKVLYLR